MYQFSKTSLKRLETCHKDLQTLMLYAIMTSPIDFGIGQGERPTEVQFDLFKKGRAENDDGKWVVIDRSKVVTNIDGITTVGKHNKKPSEAVDLFVWVPGKKELMYDNVHLAFLGGHIMKCQQELLASGKIKHSIRWGGNWDNDGELIYDQTLQDMPHYEIITD